MNTELTTKKQTNATYFNEKVHFHNNTSIVNYMANKSIPLGQRAIILFAYFYSNQASTNKAPEDRIVIQNPELLRQLGYDIPKESYESPEYEKNVSAIQSMLERYEKDAFWKRQFMNKSGKWIDLYITDENNKLTYNPEAHGLTKRRIVIDEKKIKLLLSTLPQDAETNEIKKSSRAKRMLLSRPITLVDYLLSNVQKTSAKDAVDRVNAKRRVINMYLKNQAKKHGNFTMLKVQSELEKEIALDIIKEISDYIKLDCKTLLAKYHNELAN